MPTSRERCVRIAGTDDNRVPIHLQTEQLINGSDLGRRCVKTCPVNEIIPSNSRANRNVLNTLLGSMPILYEIVDP